VTYTEGMDSSTRLRQLLKKAGLTQVGAAKQLGISPRTMRRYCSATASEEPKKVVFIALQSTIDGGSSGAN